MSDRDPVEVLGEEFLARRRRGEDPDIKQYMVQNRQYAEQIAELFPAMIAMESLKISRQHDTSPAADSSDRPIRLHIDRLQRLGDFEIVREIGHGGMGIVYEAQQQSLRRRVAVKVFPKQAIGNSQQLQRFQREAETIGSLHHTNIVPVFGVGRQDGLHYFVMQYLEGIPLDQMVTGLQSLDPSFRCDDYFRYVHDHDQPIAANPTRRDPGSFGRGYWRQLADIGIQVADALQYAHQRGVMHRDIKPSNLIFGADGRVWVTDFGLAVHHDQERLSRTGDVVGTLRYMAPEHLHGRGDFRSDIYGLGLTLFELATLQPAFPDESRGSLIRKVSRGVGIAPRSLCREIPKDLETIILKAIACSPESRYSAAKEMAADLRRFQANQPILARRISPAERLCRWSYRNPAVAGMSLALMLGGILAMGAVGWNWHQAVQEKQNALHQGERAENNMMLALEGMDRLLHRFEADWMSHPIDPLAGIAESEPQFRFVVSDHSAVILEEALDFYDRFAKQNASSPTLQRETAKAYRRAGDLLDRLGRYNDAEQAYRRCVSMMRAHQSSLPDDTEYTAEIATVLNRLAIVLDRLDRSEEAKHQLESAKQILGSVLTRQSRGEHTHELAQTHSVLGSVLWRLHQGEQALAQHRRAIFLLEGLAEQYPLESRYRLALARAYRNFYPIALVCKDEAHCEQIRQSAAEILETLVADFPAVPDYRCELSEMLTMTYSTSRIDDRTKIKQLNRAVQLAESLNREFHSIPRYQMALASALGTRAVATRPTDKQRASEQHQRANELLRQLCVRFPDVMAYQAITANALREQGVTLRELEQLDQSLGVLEEAVSKQTTYLSQLPDSPMGRKSMAAILQALADSLSADNQSTRAREIRAHSFTFWNSRPPIDP